MPSLRSRLLALFTVTLFGVALTAPGQPALRAGAQSSSHEPLTLGVSVAGAPWSLAELDAFEESAGAKPALVMYYQDWAHFPEFEPQLVDPILERGAAAMLTWEPWDYTAGADQLAYRLSRILDGSHDAHIRRWAEGIARWGRPLYLRFAHEMNGPWSSWAEQANGNKPGEYVAAWRYVRGMFDQAGAENVTWVWSPSVSAAGYTALPALAPLYPGDALVDWVGLDGYNWGTTQAWGSRWQSPAEIFDATLEEVQSITSKPVMIGETASTEEGGDKAAWITELFDWLAQHREVRTLIWFDHDKETDWRVRSSPGAAATFATAVDAATRSVPETLHVLNPTLAGQVEDWTTWGKVKVEGATTTAPATIETDRKSVGGVYQDVPGVTGGSAYELTAPLQVTALAGRRSQVKMALEWRDSAGNTVATTERWLTSVDVTAVTRSVTGTAPLGADHVRIVFASERGARCSIGTVELVGLT